MVLGIALVSLTNTLLCISPNLNPTSLHLPKPCYSNDALKLSVTPPAWVGRTNNNLYHSNTHATTPRLDS